MCDCLVALGAATDTGNVLFAKNSDRPPDEVQRVAWSPSRRDRGPLRTTHIQIDPHSTETLGCLLSIPEWCWGAEHGVNEAGVAIGNEAIYTTLDPRHAPPALIGMDLVRLALERASAALEAVDVITSLLDRYGQGGTGHDPMGRAGRKAYWSSFLIADPHAAYVLETSGRTFQVEQVETTRAISNRTTIPSFDAAHRHPAQPVQQLVDLRLTASQNVLSRRPVTRAGLVAHLRSHDSCAVDGWSVCMHARDAHGRLVEATTSSMIVELSGTGGVHRAWVLTGSPCESEYTEMVVPPR
ncbi:MAG: Dipeptidase [Ilumatobacteraceae bacterium]|nr:Dipeptidase [Ilumatobacteraceae bacterium]